MYLQANLLAAFAELLGLSANANQLIYVLRKKITNGVSGWAWTLALGGNIAWAVYGIQKQIVALFVANAVLTIIAAQMVRKIYLTSAQRKRMLMYAFCVGIGLSIIFLLYRQYAGWLAFTYGTLGRLPQLYRASKDMDLRGLSPGSIIVFIVENVTTVIYAYMLNAWPLVLSAILGIVSFFYIGLQVAKKRIKT